MKQKIWSNQCARIRLLALILLNITVLFFIHTKNGMADDPLMVETQPGAVLSDSGSQPADTDPKAVLWVVKYLNNGDIDVFDSNNNLIKKLSNGFKSNAALSELRNLTSITKKVKSDQMDSHEEGIRLRALTSPAPVYEQHYLYQDGELVSCRKHRVSPNPHPDVGSCL